MRQNFLGKAGGKAVGKKEPTRENKFMQSDGRSNLLGKGRRLDGESKTGKLRLHSIRLGRCLASTGQLVSLHGARYEIPSKVTAPRRGAGNIKIC